MAKITVLIEGYAYQGDKDIFYASPTTTLIATENKKILVDPGTNRKLLLDTLANQNLTPNEIDVIFLSHYHPDHFLNLQIFPTAEIIDGTTIWQDDKEIVYDDNYLGKDIKRIFTPGHAAEHCSLLVNTVEGVVCIAQDVFWWVDGEQQTDDIQLMINKPDPFASNFNELVESRKKVLKISDWIIPGHGKKFRNHAKEFKL